MVSILARGPAAFVGSCVLLGLLCAPRAYAADTTIQRILIEGNERISDEAVLHLLTIKIGDPYDEATLREEFKRIWARGLFRDLSIESRAVEGGVAVIVHVQEKEIVTSLRYDESKIVSETQIEDFLEQRGALVSIGEPVDLGVIKKAEEGIKGLLNQKGFLDAEVHGETRDLGNGNVEVFYNIIEGSMTRIKKIEFVGNTVFKDRELKKALKLTKEKGMFTRMGQKDVYHPLKYDTDVREVESMYANRGYIDIDLPPPKVSIVEMEIKEKPGKSRTWVTIEQRVVEGTQYRVGKIAIEGNTVFSTEELTRLLPLIPGQILGEANIKLGLARIDEIYGRRGYFYVSTNRLLTRHPDGTADVTVKINEDQQYHLDRIDFAGNLSTRDFVLRREMQVDEGELFDLTKFRIGLRRITQLGYFELRGEPEITPMPGQNMLKVNVKGIEPRRSELQLGGGYSGVDGGFFAASYQTRNFMGRGNLVTLNGQVGSIASRYVISLTEPYLFGRPITAGFSVFKRDQDYSGYETSGTGGSVTVGRRFRNFHNVSTLFLHENTDFNPQDGVSSSATINSIRPLYVFDTRNSFVRPTRGAQFLVSTEYAGGALGGDTSFIKPFAEYQYFKSMIKNHYLALHLEAGYVTAVGDNILPTYERFFLGGERSMRNFGTQTVGPTGFVCNFGLNEAVQDLEDCPPPPRGLNHNRSSLGFSSDSVGGNRELLLNLEYVVPLSEPIDFLAYLDAGNAFAEWESITLDRIRGDFGFELRFFLPVFGAPLRLIWGQTFNVTGQEDTKQFLFSIGRTF